MIDAYCNESATILVSGGYTELLNEPEAPTTKPIKCKYFDKRTLMMDAKGEQVVASGYFLIRKDDVITNEDKILYDNVKYVIIKIENMKDFSQTHFRVWVK